MNRPYKTIEERQSFVVRTGKELENQIFDYLNRELEKYGVKIIKGDDIKNNIKKYAFLYDYLSIPLKESKSKKIWGDIDLVAVDSSDNYPIAIISCKTSFHGRFTETFFYSIIFRLLTRIKFILVTADAGRGQKYKWQSELGSEDKPTKDREMASNYLDGLYTINKKTKLGGIVKFITDLPKDIVYWKEGLIKTQKI
ncbi:MAG: BsaWI family type II restriction enzyme [Candidatus Omnitrophica bacterium]|nr:BsaWI family type II restriction enzyme [Candidatus Omnitrophota bacterium]